MFDIGFSEILVIFILALLVLGPERLPRVVREVGRWVGRARAMARQFQEQLEEEVDVDRNPPSWRSPGPPTPEHAEPTPDAPHPQAPVAADPPSSSTNEPGS
jgi:sec-independent protein translocase protein TatB